MTQEKEMQNTAEGARQCPKCGNWVKENFNVCTKCGTVLSVRKITSIDLSEDKLKITKKLGMGVGAFTFIALVLLFQVSAMLGMILYFIAFAIAINAFKDDERISKGNYAELVKECFRKENLLSKGILMAVILIVPIVLSVGLYRWIITDTIREVDNMYNQYGGY